MNDATTAGYWEERARRFASDGAGLRAVCSYGMPQFYNGSIDFCQRLALEPWTRTPPDRVLDVGCGVGRWSRRLARRGASVVGLDWSATMVRDARRRAEREGLASRCEFRVEDVADFDLGCQFPLVLGITVLQHVMDHGRVAAAVERLATHLEPGGRLVLLEAAPTRPTSRCDSSIFVARDVSFYLELFARAGLDVVRVTGVDLSPLKAWFLPYYRRLPRPLAVAGLAAATAASLPVDAVAGRAWVGASWHKVFVLTRKDSHRDPR